MEIVDFLAADELLAVEMQDEAALVNDVLSLDHVLRVGELERKMLLVSQTLDFEDCSESSLSDLCHDLVKLGRICPLDLTGL